MTMNHQAEPEDIEQNLRFQGQYLDRGTGLHYNTFRYYDPDVGRFISPDPIGLMGGMNPWAYGPNPVSWVDPLGWCAAKKNVPKRGAPALKGDSYHPDRVFKRQQENKAYYGKQQASTAPLLTSRSRMQRAVEKGQAPREVDGVDGPHGNAPSAQPHVHYRDGTSSNVDGTIHDAHKGTPNPSRRTRAWLEDNNWIPPE
jgi:RHS repeat-associated protein